MLVAVFFGVELREVPADDLLGAVAFDARRAGIPARHDAARVEHDQRIIGDARGQEMEAPFAVAQLFDRPALVGDVTAGEVDVAGIGGHGPGDPAPGAVLVAEAVFHAHGGHALRQPGAAGDRRRRVLGVAQFAHVHRLDLVLAPAEQARPGRIDAGEVALEIGDAEQILRHHPDAVAFARAPAHLRFQLIGEHAQLAGVAHAAGGLVNGDQNSADAVLGAGID